MKKIEPDELFACYPHYPNLEELKKADILIMPSYTDGLFNPSQGRIFRGISSEYNVNCLFYSEEQDRLKTRLYASAPPPDAIVYLGMIISSVDILLQVYNILKDRISNKKFHLKHVVKTNDGYYELDEFEGTAEEYKKVMKEIRCKLMAFK